MPSIRDPGRLAAVWRTALLDTPSEEAFDRLTRLGARILSAPIVLVSLVEDDRQYFKSAVGLPESLAAQRERPLTSSLCRHTVESTQPFIVHDATQHPGVQENSATEQGVRAYVGIPLITSEGHTIGTFCAIDNEPRSWTDEEVAIMEDLAASVITEIELRLEIAERRRVESALRTLSLVDDLTGLYNRRGFLTLAEQRLELAQREGNNLLLLFSDMDRLKRVNDTYGHSEGDHALIQTAGVLQETFRESDITARIGGDEFVVLAIEADEDSADILRGRLQENLRRCSARLNRPYLLSVSAGVARYDPDAPLSVTELLTRADTLMYEEKRRKRL